MKVIIYANTDVDKQLKFLSTVKYPIRVPMKKGSANWTSGDKFKVKDKEVSQYDIVIDGNLNILANDLPPYITKQHTYMQNASNLSIALAGMKPSCVSMNDWESNRFDCSKIKQMVSIEQFEKMAWVFAFFSIWYWIPVDHILTHAEWAKFKNYYPGMPDGYYPDRWDLDGEGNNLRSRIKYHKVSIADTLLKIGALK